MGFDHLEISIIKYLYYVLLFVPWGSALMLGMRRAVRLARGEL